jgi:hypothetical protein
MGVAIHLCGFRVDFMQGFAPLSQKQQAPGHDEVMQEGIVEVWIAFRLLPYSRQPLAGTLVRATVLRRKELDNTVIDQILTKNQAVGPVADDVKGSVTVFEMLAIPVSSEHIAERPSHDCSRAQQWILELGAYFERSV